MRAPDCRETNRPFMSRMSPCITRCLTVSLTLTVLCGSIAAAQQTPVEPAEDGVVTPAVLQDYNLDGRIDVAAFGDSITRGVGDFTPVGADDYVIFFPEENAEAGYPLRVERLVGVNVLNRGLPGEKLAEGGLERFIRTIVAERPDVAVISEGANDARTPTTFGAYFRLTQTMINVARAVNIQPVLMTIAPPCCNHSNLRGTVDQYNTLLRALANINEIPLADVSRGYANTCNLGNCYLFNLPEGLHPNTEGYDVIGEIVSATLLQINLFGPDGATLFAQATGILPTDVQTKPDPVVTPVTP